MNPNDANFRKPLEAALHHALTYLKKGDDGDSIAATATLAELRAKLDLPLPDGGVDATTVVDELVAGVDGGLLRSRGGRFFAWVIGGSLPASLAADWMTSVWDQNAGLYCTSPAAAVVEETAGAWLKELLQVPREASFALVTGCQMAHVTCLVAARHGLLAAKGWDVVGEGLAGSPQIRVLTSGEVHSSTMRAVRLLGLGEKHVAKLGVDAQGRLLQSELERELVSAARAPTLVVLQAGDLHMGAYDDFRTLIPLAKRYGAWVHIDGAFGLWAAASARHRHRMDGAELADSWSTDGHKWLNTPYDCGYAFVRDAKVHRDSLALRASYVTMSDAARDEMDWNPEWSRRARGFATYAAIRELGRDGIEALIDRCCEHAHGIVMGVGALDGAEVVWEPTINQGMLRFFDPAAGASDGDHDVYTERVIAEILRSGEAFFSGSTWRGRKVMRVSVCGWQTSTEDVAKVVACVAEILKRRA